MALEPTQTLHIITPTELPSFILQTDQWHHQLPPPGTELVFPGPLGPLVDMPYVVGEPSAGAPGDKWWATLGQISLPLGGLAGGWIARMAGAAGVAIRSTFIAEDIPVVFDQGGSVMKWIASTIRGSLAGIEQFQFGLNWGNPGSDPDLDDAALLTFATTLRDTLQSTLATSYASIAPLSTLGPSVKFEEVGAVMKTQTSATAKDGTGGNLEQGGTTQWAAYPTAGRPTGGSSSITLPFEVSCALTLHTDMRGPSGRGRIYLPPFGVGYLQEGGKFTTATCQCWGLWAGGLFTAMTTATSHVPVVVSRRRLVLHEIKSVTTGVIPDSQRRRRRSQDEAPVAGWVHP